MDVIERRRANCLELGQIVRRYCVRIAVSWLCTSRIVVARASHYWPFFHHAIGDWTIFYLGVILPKHILCAKVFRGILAEARRLKLLQIREEEQRTAIDRAVALYLAFV